MGNPVANYRPATRRKRSPSPRSTDKLSIVSVEVALVGGSKPITK
jgi:hypothetical protein